LRRNEKGIEKEEGRRKKIRTVRRWRRRKERL
jgi:hypothetical protein